MTESEKFVGSWRLVSTEFRGEDGSETASPYTTDSAGLLMYDALGNMSAQLARANRQPFPVNDRKGGSYEETKSAFETYQAYYGSYKVDESEGTITHTVTQALLPNWVGSNQVRYYSFEGGRLILRTPPMKIGGKLATGTLVWERMDSVRE